MIWHGTPANNPYVDAMIRKNRARYGVKLFAPKGGDGARELLAGMQRGESVALMNDQKFSEGPEVTFFGQPVNAAPGPSRLALRFGTSRIPVREALRTLVAAYREHQGPAQ